MQSSLGLAGDLDDVELVEDVEAAFGVRFADDDLKACRTVGDIFSLLETGLPGDGTSCATAMTFYRMRRALQPLVGVELRPSTAIEQLQSIPVRRLYDVIRQDCQLRAPPAVISLWGCLALALVPLAPLASVAFGIPWWIAAFTATPAIGLYSVAPVRLPASVRTFGDLVRKVSARSIGSLAADGARLRSVEAWPALTMVLSDHTALPAEAIRRDTLILAPKRASSPA